MTSVGRGSNLLLNVPPDRRGLIHENDVESLRKWRQMLDEAFSTNLAEGAEASADSYRGSHQEYAPINLTDGDSETYWATDDAVDTGEFEIILNEPAEINYIVLQEYIRLGQRVRSFSVDVWEEGEWKPAAEGTTIGYKRILEIDPITTDRVRIQIEDSQANPVISNIEVY
jgi:alpha-L-fucosidase